MLFIGGKKKDFVGPQVRLLVNCVTFTMIFWAKKYFHKSSLYVI